MDNSLVTVQAAGTVTNAKTFDDLIDAWFKSDAMFRVREQSQKSYRKSLKSFNNWVIAQGITQPCKQDVKNWCASMDAEGLSVATKNLRLTTLRNFCKWLSAEYGTTNIVDGLKGWKETKEHRRGFLSCEEMKTLLSVVETGTLRGLRDKAIIKSRRKTPSFSYGDISREKVSA